MTTVRNARGIVEVTNEYDSSGRVLRQTFPDTGTYQFAYTLNKKTSAIQQTDVTDPRGTVRRRPTPQATRSFRAPRSSKRPTSGSPGRTSSRR